jgi:ATP-dependent Clp protease ATP-binding subunit ClpC
VLLDEFEKAHPRVWDLFLQVFDDGRLSDRSGRTADFRHCIIVLTSNLGATIDKGGGPGFVSTRGAFSREAVGRTIDATFRREFVNRLDRVVVFRPLSRALMREILHKELRAVLNRRGFRGRDWAVEWEPSAIEFLLERGFTPDLGARPLRRAIDQYLLAPLSRTIVEHRVPSGEQFLFVQAGGDGLEVRFVDPDAPAEPAAADARPSATTSAPGDLRALALDPRAGETAHAVLGHAIAACRAQVDDAPWLALKSSQAREMEQAGFWQREDRQSVLDRLERVDRIESGLRAAEALEARLLRGGGRGAPDLVRRLALSVLALERGITALREDAPEDALLELRPTDPRAPGALAWRDALLAMYRGWGEARGIRMQARPADPATAAVRIEASGLGAWQALRGEAGLHVLERRIGETESRSTVRVAVSPVPGPAPGMAGGDGETRLVRRYDDGPAPLVRDAQRGWRSGRLDRVLAGDFDLMGPGEG